MWNLFLVSFLILSFIVSRLHLLIIISLPKAIESPFNKYTTILLLPRNFISNSGTHHSIYILSTPNSVSSTCISPRLYCIIYSSNYYYYYYLYSIIKIIRLTYIIIVIVVYSSIISIIVVIVIKE